MAGNGSWGDAQEVASAVVTGWAATSKEPEPTSGAARTHEDQMPHSNLRDHYRAYILTLNERRFDDLVAFVADELVYNDKPMTAVEYRQLLKDDVRRIPDLFYDIEGLVVDGNDVASRIRYDCTPVEPFRGLRPTGSRISFTEHVFYRFHDGHIVRVWSLLDMDALRRQLTS